MPLALAVPKSEVAATERSAGARDIDQRELPVGSLDELDEAGRDGETHGGGFRCLHRADLQVPLDVVCRA